MKSKKRVIKIVNLKIWVSDNIIKKLLSKMMIVLNNCQFLK